MQSDRLIYDIPEEGVELDTLQTPISPQYNPILNSVLTEKIVEMVSNCRDTEIANHLPKLEHYSLHDLEFIYITLKNVLKNQEAEEFIGDLDKLFVELNRLCLKQIVLENGRNKKNKKLRSSG